jgi:hypothetical protein
MSEPTTLSAPTLPHYRRFQGLHVLRIGGSDYEMGFQHGQILKEAIFEGAVPYFSVYLEKILRQGVGAQAAKTLKKGLDRWVGSQLVAGFPAHVKAHVRGLAEGSGMDESLIWQAFVLPDTFLWLSAQSQKMRKLEIAPQLAVQTLGCSSAVAYGAATEQGQMLHARNLDYMGAHAWDKEAAVLFCEPEDGLKYLSVTSAGIPLGGVTAMNEAGLTLAVHQHIASPMVQLGGQPVGIVGDEVMRRAHTLDQARKILDAHHPNACWTYVIASAREKAVLCYEVTGTDRHWFVSEAETFAYTNMYFSKRLADTETHMYPSQWRSNQGRFQHIQTYLEDRQGNLSAQDMAALLGDRVDPRCRLRTPLAMLLTVSSVVFDPDQGIAWVGAGSVPTSTRPYYAFDLKQGCVREDLAPLKGRDVPASEEQAFACYTRGYLAYFDADDKQVALEELEAACQIQPREPIYAYITALVALSARKPELALHYLHRALEIGHPDPERVAAFYLWRGRAFDAAGLRSDARQDYSTVLAQPKADDLVKKAAEKGLHKIWKAKSLGIEFNYADVLIP